MTSYHRGKARSPYRKRYKPINVNHSAVGPRVQFLEIGRASGLVETKSWRGHVTVLGDGGQTSTQHYGQGWMGFYRGQLDAATLQALTGDQVLAMSETIGVVPWTFGFNDHLVELNLVGITLAVAEGLAFVSHCDLVSGGGLQLVGSMLYAEKEIPA